MALREAFEGLSPTEVKQHLQSLPEVVRRKAINSPYLWARDKQLKVIRSDAHKMFVHSGRGFGKNWTGAHWIIDQARRRSSDAPLAIIGRTAGDVRDYMIKGPSGILTLAPESFRPKHTKTDRLLEFPNGVEVNTYSGDDPDSLRGLSGAAIWCDELAKYQYPKMAWEQIKYALREGDNPQVLITTTPKPIDVVHQLKDEADLVVSGDTFENSANLADDYLEDMREEAKTDRGRQEVHGEILEDMGDLWTYGDIGRVSPDDVPELVRIVIGLDPSIKDDEGDEAGIVVAGKDAHDNAYVLADRSDQMTTTEWAEEVVDVFWAEPDDYIWAPADAIHAERNQGGGLVENNIRSVDQRVAYSSTHTTSSKRVRAEPVHSLYQRGKVKHVGQHSDLEDQMTDFMQDDKDSPDRVDALVYAVSELLLSDELSGFSSDPVIPLD